MAGVSSALRPSGAVRRESSKEEPNPPVAVLQTPASSKQADPPPEGLSRPSSPESFDDLFDVLTLDGDSEDDSDVEVISQGFGLWELDTDPRTAFYQFEVISLTLGSMDAGDLSDKSRPTHLGLELSLENGQDRTFAQFRKAHQRTSNFFPVSSPHTANSLFTLKFTRRPSFSVPCDQFEVIPPDWVWARDAGRREGESMRVRIEVIALQGRASGNYSAGQTAEWLERRLSTCRTTGSRHPKSIPVRLKPKGRTMPIAFINVPLPPPQVAPPEKIGIAPLFLDGGMMQPPEEWHIRYRWRVNTWAAWKADREKELAEETG